MKQEQVIKINSEDNKIVVYIDNGTSFGVLHDFLLNLKGIAVERMYAAQKQEEEAANKVKEQEQNEEENVE